MSDEVLSPQQRFKVGFMLRCIDEGLTNDEIRDRVKVAAAVLGIDKQAMPGLSSVAKLVGWGFPAAALTGITGGYLAGKLTENEITPEDQKVQELISAYDMHADRARRARMRQSQRQQRSVPLEHSMPGGPAFI